MFCETMDACETYIVLDAIVNHPLFQLPVFLVARRNRCHFEVLEKGKDREACCKNRSYQSYVQFEQSGVFTKAPDVCLPSCEASLLLWQ